MKKVQNCVVENCIPSPTSCHYWNAGDIDYLGICNGDPLNNLIWEIVTKLQELAGEDLSQFDIEGLLDICNQKAPQEKTIASILTLVKENQICLKDYIDNLDNKLQELFQDQGIDINLKCYANFDNLGNSLSITRKELDQLIIDNLCNHKLRIESLEGKITLIQSQVNNIEENQSLDEMSVATCVDAGVKPTSQQVVAVAEAHCDLETAVGTPAHIATALSKVPSDWNTEFGLISGWDLTPDNMAQTFGNVLLALKNALDRIKFMEDNCCALSCDDIKLGFSAVFNEDLDGVILKFTSGAGTSIPPGFEDLGSTGTITDIDGNVESFNLTIENNAEIEVPITGLNLSEPLTINITAKIGTEGLVCQKCLSKKVMSAVCAYCEITATGEEGSSAVIIYDDNKVGGSVISTPASETTTTSTTTTTTVAP